MDTQQQRGAHALRESERAARRGDLAAADRWTKIAVQAADAAERLSAANVLSEEEDEKMRAELRRRFARFQAYDFDVQTWKIERRVLKEMSEIARRTGCPAPPPLRPHPAGDPKYEEQRYVRLMTDPEPGPEPEDGPEAETP